MIGRAIALLILAMMTACVYAPATVRSEFQIIDSDGNNFSDKAAQDDQEN